MNTIEQTTESKNGAVHVDIPAEWEGYVLKVTIERTEAKVEKPKRTGLSKHRAAFGYLPLEQRLAMQKELDDMRNEWDRPIL